jgi:SH3 domain protein
MPKFNNFKRSITLTALLAVAPSLTVTSVFAQTQGFTHYISDQIEVPMRRGAGSDFRIERMIPTGTPIKILETSDGWSRVELRLNNRTWTGWVHQIAIQYEPPARLVVEEQTERLKKVEARLKTLQSEHTTLQTTFDQRSAELEQIKQEKFEVDKQLEYIQQVSGNSLELEQQNQSMRQKVAELETQNVILREQIAQSEDTIKRQWFLTGAGVLLLGLLIGRFFKIPSRRSSWDKI